MAKNSKTSQPKFEKFSPTVPSGWTMFFASFFILPFFYFWYQAKSRNETKEKQLTIFGTLQKLERAIVDDSTEACSARFNDFLSACTGALNELGLECPTKPRTIKEIIAQFGTLLEAIGNYDGDHPQVVYLRREFAETAEFLMDQLIGRCENEKSPVQESPAIPELREVEDEKTSLRFEEKRRNNVLAALDEEVSNLNKQLKLFTEGKKTDDGNIPTIVFSEKLLNICAEYGDALAELVREYRMDVSEEKAPRPSRRMRTKDELVLAKQQAFLTALSMHLKVSDYKLGSNFDRERTTYGTLNTTTLVCKACVTSCQEYHQHLQQKLALNQTLPGLLLILNQSSQALLNAEREFKHLEDPQSSRVYEPQESSDYDETFEPLGVSIPTRLTEMNDPYIFLALRATEFSQLQAQLRETLEDARIPHDKIPLYLTPGKITNPGAVLRSIEDAHNATLNALEELRKEPVLSEVSQIIAKYTPVVSQIKLGMTQVEGYRKQELMQSIELNPAAHAYYSQVQTLLRQAMIGANAASSDHVQRSKSSGEQIVSSLASAIGQLPVVGVAGTVVDGVGGAILEMREKAKLDNLTKWNFITTEENLNDLAFMLTLVKWEEINNGVKCTEEENARPRQIQRLHKEIDKLDKDIKGKRTDLREKERLTKKEKERFAETQKTVERDARNAEHYDRYSGPHVKNLENLESKIAKLEKKYPGIKQAWSSLKENPLKQNPSWITFPVLQTTLENYLDEFRTNTTEIQTLNFKVEERVRSQLNAPNEAVRKTEQQEQELRAKLENLESRLAAKRERLAELEKQKPALVKKIAKKGDDLYAWFGSLATSGLTESQGSEASVGANLAVEDLTKMFTAMASGNLRPSCTASRGRDGMKADLIRLMSRVVGRTGDKAEGKGFQHGFLLDLTKISWKELEAQMVFQRSAEEVALLSSSSSLLGAVILNYRVDSQLPPGSWDRGLFGAKPLPPPEPRTLVSKSPVSQPPFLGSGIPTVGST